MLGRSAQRSLRLYQPGRGIVVFGAVQHLAIAGILDAIRQLMAPPPPKKRPIGFVTGDGKT